MKVAILADTHAGVRNNSNVFMEHQIRFFEEVFFPYVEEHQIKHMIHLGDVFDRRKDTNNYALHEWDERVFSAWNDLFDESHIIIGNHDTYFKNTNAVNTPERLFIGKYDKFCFYTDPCEKELFGVQSLILPWVCEDNQSRTRQLIEESDASLALGHLEIVGCPMFRGIDNLDKGFEPEVFSKFKMVLSGHFHLKSHQKNIDYLGAPYATMWAEAFDPRGFHVIDMNSLKLTFIQNKHNPFVHIDYDGAAPTVVPEVKGKVVRVLVKRKESESNYLEFLESLETQGPAEINVSEQRNVTELQTSADSTLDLFSLIDLYVDSLQFESPRGELKQTLRDLYHEAVNLHDISE